MLNDFDREEGLKFCLKNYYANFFPVKRIIRWLNYDENNEFGISQREFSFTNLNDQYMRYLSFRDPSEFLERLLKELPKKIDIGAFYNLKPSERNSTSGRRGLEPLQHELVFDIDLSDYNDIRTCCKDKMMCSNCWTFLAFAILLIEHVIKEDFGFKDIFWVFSGRRGVHGWICDKKARLLTSFERKCIISYIELLKNDIPQIFDYEYVSQKSDGYVSLMKQFFGRIIKHFSFISDSHIRDILNSANLDKKAKDSLQEILENKFEAESFFDLINSKKENRYILNIFFNLFFPRLDYNVTVQLNHLLKSPFSPHPVTGTVCLPFSSGIIENFDPVCSSFNIHDLNSNQNAFYASLDYFNDFLLKLKRNSYC